MARNNADVGKQTDAGNDILVMLSGINKGRLVSEATDKLTGLVDAVTRYEKKGSLSITIEVAPGSEDGTVNTKATVVVRAPQREHPAVFFVDADHDHRLTRDDPAMTPMFGRDEFGGR